MQYRLTLRSAAVIAAASALAVTVGDAGAQTLVDPSSKPPPSRQPPPAAKPRPSAHVQSCSAYGSGFVNTPGTGTCIKIGGSVSVEGTVSRAR